MCKLLFILCHGRPRGAAPTVVFFFALCSLLFADPAFAAKNTFNSNVGIGSTAAPSAKLEITASGSEASTPLLRVRNLTGSDAMYVCSSGCVGIGTTTPKANLAVIGNASAGAVNIDLGNNAATAAGNAVRLRFPTYSALVALPQYSPYITALEMNGGTGASDLAFGTWNGSTTSEVVRLTSGGNVGIGASAPAALLDLSPGVSMTTTPIFQAKTLSQVNAIYVGTNGCVDIGSTYTSFGRLAVLSGITRNTGLSIFPSVDVTDGLRLYLSGTNNPTGIIENVWDSAGSILYKDIAFNPNGGNVGIGTTAPGGVLHVYAGASGQATPNGDSKMVIEDNAGNVLNMLSPNANYSGLYFGSPSGASRGGIIYTNSSYSGSTPADALAFSTAGSLRAIIDSSGNVGIGTTSPVHTLQVGTGAGSTFGSRNMRARHLDGHDGTTSWGYDTLFLQYSAAGKGVVIGDTGTDHPLSVYGTGYFASNVGIGTASTSYLLHVNGSFAATYKNFEIDHPLDPKHKHLVHSVTEGPEHSVFYRGKASLKNGEATVVLPRYFEALARPEGRTVQLTPEGACSAVLYVNGGVHHGAFMVRSTRGGNPSQEFYWEVKAVRADVPELIAEREKEQQTMHNGTPAPSDAPYSNDTKVESENGMPNELQLARGLIEQQNERIQALERRIAALEEQSKRGRKLAAVNAAPQVKNDREAG